MSKYRMVVKLTSGDTFLSTIQEATEDDVDHLAGIIQDIHKSTYFRFKDDDGDTIHIPNVKEIVYVKIQKLDA